MHDNDEVTCLGPDGWVRLPDGAHDPEPAEPASDNDPYDYYDLDIDTIQAAALARCEAMGVGAAWMAEFESLPLAERRETWNALTSGQRTAYRDYNMAEPCLADDADDDERVWTEDELPF